MRQLKLISLLLIVFFCFSCSSNEYEFEAGSKLCIDNEIYSAKKSDLVRSKYRRLLVKVENFPVDVSLSFFDKSSVKRSLLLAIEGFDENNINKLFARTILSNLDNNRLIFNSDLNLYKIDYHSESALNSYDYLISDPRKIEDSKQLEYFPKWHLASCVEGIGDRPDSCKINYQLDNFWLKFSVVHDALKDWKSVVKKVNSTVNSWDCSKIKNENQRS